MVRMDSDKAFMYFIVKNFKAEPILVLATLRELQMENNLGVQLDHKCSSSKQCQPAAGKATQTLECIKKGISSQHKLILLPLNKTKLVQPYNERS